MFKELITKNRSYRRFFEEETVSKETLLDLVDNARLSASGANMQPLKYFISFEKEVNEKIFPTLGWAGYLKDWDGPEPGERPSAYIIILQDKNIKMVAGVDHGIAAQSILLGAVDKGLGGCIIGNIERSKLMGNLNIPGDYEILLVVALGKAKEVVAIEEIDEGGDVRYWRDENQVHHVPKRKLAGIVLQLKR